MKLTTILAFTAAIFCQGCGSTGSFSIQGDLTAIGIPAKIHYSSGKNPIRSGK